MRRWIFGILPILLLALFVAALLLRGPLGVLRGNAPPVQRLSLDRLALKTDEIALYVINDGPEPIVIAQVMVNGALWAFTSEPAGELGRLASAVIRIPYPWIEGDTEHIQLITREGVTFDYEVPVAVSTPVLDRTHVTSFLMVGIYVGIIPVFLGLLWMPFLRQLREGWYNFFLALTVGFLLFLGVDTLIEAIDLAGRTPEGLGGSGALVLGLAASFLTLETISRWSRARGKGDAQQKLLLALFISIGIGIHNLGEGLAIGSAYAVGEAALGTLLVLGFMIHNVTEGVAIVAPVAKTGASIARLAGMGLLAGAPAILGTWIGAFAYSSLWGVVFFAVGAGAIFQVLLEIVRHMARGDLGSLATAGNVTGLVTGVAVMYATGLFVAA
jgi:zinc transporter ZupT